MEDGVSQREDVMKPSRKLNRGSFMSRVSGGEARRPAAGQSAVESDHDLVHPARRAAGRADPDSGGTDLDRLKRRRH